MYCYEIEKVIYENGGTVPVIKTNYCKYHTFVLIKNIKIPFCLYLCKGSIVNLSDEEYSIIEKALSKEVIDEVFNLDLLWDGVPECGLSDDEIKKFIKERK